MPYILNKTNQELFNARLRDTCSKLGRYFPIENQLSEPIKVGPPYLDWAIDHM